MKELSQRPRKGLFKGCTFKDRPLENGPSEWIRGDGFVVGYSPIQSKFVTGSGLSRLSTKNKWSRHKVKTLRS